MQQAQTSQQTANQQYQIQQQTTGQSRQAVGNDVQAVGQHQTQQHMGGGQTVSPNKKERKSQQSLSFQASQQQQAATIGYTQRGQQPNYPQAVVQNSASNGPQSQMAQGQPQNFFMSGGMMQQPSGVSSNGNQTAQVQNQISGVAVPQSAQGSYPSSKVQQLNQLNSQIKQAMTKAGVPASQVQQISPQEYHAIMQQQQMQGGHVSVSPMPMPPTQQAVHHVGAQQQTGAILNHHRRKQFRNMPAGNKLEQLQHHSLATAQHHGQGFPVTAAVIKQGGSLRNSYMISAQQNTGNPVQPLQVSQGSVQGEYYVATAHTPNGQTQSQQQVQAKMANQMVLQQLGKAMPGTVQPQHSSKMRTQIITSGAQQQQANSEQQFVAQQRAAMAGVSPDQANGTATGNGNFYKMKSTQNMRLDDDIARERGSQQSVPIEQQRLSQINGNQPLVTDQSQQAKLTQQNFYHQQQQLIPVAHSATSHLHGQHLQVPSQTAMVMRQNQQLAQKFKQQNSTPQQHQQVQPAGAQQAQPTGQMRQKGFKRRVIVNVGPNGAPTQNIQAQQQSQQVAPMQPTTPVHQHQTQQQQSIMQASNFQQASQLQQQQYQQQQQQVQQQQQQLQPIQEQQKLTPPPVPNQRVAPSRGGPSTYWHQDEPTDTQSQPDNPAKVHMQMLRGGMDHALGHHHFPQRVIAQRDITFLNGGNNSTMSQGPGQPPISIEFTRTHLSPNKKSTFNVNGNNSSNNNAGQTASSNNQGSSNNAQVERITINIPNPLLMPNASVQVQYQQELVRNVLQRVDDIFHLRQIVDIKNNKLKDKAAALNDQDCTAVFDEVKNRELQRINKENSMLQRFKDARIEDKLLKKQFVKGCKKISLAFKGVVDEDEELERELTQSKELLLSEVGCLEIMGEKLSKKQICAMTAKAKLVEASLKEKDYDPYFSICIVLQGARNSFMREVCRHIECYAENVESPNAQNVVRRIYKNMSDTHHVRRVKLFKDLKIDKYFKLLIAFNDDSKRHIAIYKSKYQEAQQRQQNLENFLNQEVNRLNRERREGSSMNRKDSATAGDRDNSSGAGSRVRGSVNREFTPNKNLVGGHGKMHQSLSSSDTNIVSIKNHAAAANGRNIKTPQSSNNQNQNSSTGNHNSMTSQSKDTSQKPTRLQLKMLSQNSKQKVLSWQQQNQLQQSSQKKPIANSQRKSQQMGTTAGSANNNVNDINATTSRKSLKQLQQMKRRQQQAANELSENQEGESTRTGGFESRIRRTTSGAFTHKGFGYSGGWNGEQDDTTPPLSSYAAGTNHGDLLVADSYGEKPRWFTHYVKGSKGFRSYMMRRHMLVGCIDLSQIQEILNKNVVKDFWQVKDDDRQQKVLNLILIRNVLRLQYFWRAVSKMRHDAAVRIQRVRRTIQERWHHSLEVQQRVDQLQFRTMVRKIQKWFRGRMKLVRSRRSKVNPAVEQVLRDPQRVQNSKMIQEILIPIVLKIQRAIRYWIYKRKYLPYLRLKRLRDKVRVTKKNTYGNMYRQYQPNLQHESAAIYQQVGFEQHMKAMPSYFVNLCNQAQKQLNEEDVRSVIKSRLICETRLENAYDDFRRERIYETKHVRTHNLIHMYYT